MPYAELEPNEPSPSITPIKVRDAYVHALQGLTEGDRGNPYTVEVAANEIAQSEAPLAQDIPNYAAGYTEWWERRQPDAVYWQRIFEACKCDVFSDLPEPVEDLYAVLVQSFVFSGLAIDGPAIISTGRFLGKSVQWIQGQYDTHQIDFSDLHNSARGVNAKTLRSLGKSASRTLQATETLLEMGYIGTSR